MCSQMNVLGFNKLSDKNDGLLRLYYIIYIASNGTDINFATRTAGLGTCAPT